jgi:tetratricopeptide (TPR) repeat protein
MFEDALVIARLRQDHGLLAECQRGLGETIASVDPSVGLPILEEALLGARLAAAPRLETECLLTLGEANFECAMYESSQHYLQQALAIATVQQDAQGVADALVTLGRIESHSGNVAQARSLWERALAAFRTLGDPIGISSCLSLLGSLSTEEGRFEAACAQFAESMHIRQELGDEEAISWCLRGFAIVAARTKQSVRAVELTSAAIRARQRASAPPFPGYADWVEDLLRAVSRELSTEQLRSTWSYGDALSLAHAIALAREVGTNLVVDQQSE